jgi:hypothetical protein
VEWIIMKNLNRVRIAMAASAALGLATVGTSASAQYGDEEYCRMMARNVCGYDSRGYPIWPTIECTTAEYEACMNGYASLPVKKPVIGVRRSEVQLASRSAAAARL